MSRQDRIDEAAQFLGLAAGHLAAWGVQWKEVGLYDGLFREAMAGPRLNDQEWQSLRMQAIRRAEQYLRKSVRDLKIEADAYDAYISLAIAEIDRVVGEYRL